jgi:NADH-quinone oxidoreductase subunit L
MRTTFILFLIATLAISGIIPFAGFWSKDEILGSILAYAQSTGNFWLYLLWIVGLLTVALTAFYMFRLFFGIFMGSYRGAAVAEKRAEDEDEEPVVAVGHHTGGVHYYDIHDAPPVMAVPLVILGILSIIGGFVGSLALFGVSKWHPLESFLAPVQGFGAVKAPVISIGTDWTSTGLSLALAIAGILLAWRLYRHGFEYKENRNPFYQFVLNKYYIDEALTTVLIRPVLALSRGATRVVESFTLDGGSRGIAWLFRGTSGGLRRLQTGYIRNYALAIMFGVVLIVLYYAVRG